MKIIRICNGIVKVSEIRRFRELVQISDTVIRRLAVPRGWGKMRALATPWLSKFVVLDVFLKFYMSKTLSHIHARKI